MRAVEEGLELWRIPDLLCNQKERTVPFRLPKLFHMVPQPKGLITIN